MKFSELITAFENYTGAEGEVENIALALWFNEAQIDLQYSLGTITTYEYEDAEADTAYSLPTDVLVLTGSDVDYYIDQAGKIVFAEGGDINIYYRAQPTDFTGLDEDAESDLPSNIHQAIAMFAASRYWDKESEGDSEESAHAAKWFGYYYQAKNQAISKMNISPTIDCWTVI